MNGISLMMPSVKQKTGKKRSRRKRLMEPIKQDENVIIESEEKESRKKVKKMKIRLADPNIPDSYICEVFDSSLEQDELEIESEKEKIKESQIKNLNLNEKSKPKDYFDVLMSKGSKKNTVSLDKKIQEQRRFLREIESDHLIRDSKIMKNKNKGKLVKVNKVEESETYSSSISDDDSLFQVQTKMRIFPTRHKERTFSSETVCSASNNKNNKSHICQEDGDLPQTNGISLIKKNKSNILNYFSKSNSSNGKVGTAKFGMDVFEEMKSSDMEEVREADGPKSERRNEVVKLAPLFQKKTKNVIDPKVQKARLEFLQNGLPSIMRKICNNRNNMEEKYSSILFPIVSHVQQKDDDPMWISDDIYIPSLKTDEEDSYFAGKDKVFRFEMAKNIVRDLIETEKRVIGDGLNDLILKYRGLNVELIFYSFKEKRDSFLKKFGTTGLDQISCTRSDSVRMFPPGDGYNSLWTEIYKPKSSEIIGNKQTVAKLSNWLKSWKEYNYKVNKSNVKNENKESDSVDVSEDDFFLSNNEDAGLRVPKNICLLSGPIGSGKTALVYALASELDYNVLEVNASTKRTGKKLLLDLQEATKSHEVSSGFGLSTGNNEVKQKPKAVKKKKRRKNNETNMDVQNNGKISLILIEDADIYFEDHDEGFVSAISTLVQSTKRPFIFLSNDPNYGYLERLKVQRSLMLEMRRPNFQNSCAVLDVIAVLEGVSVEKEILENLIQSNKYDLRKSILELQFWLQSGKNLKQSKPFELGKLWWGFNKFLYRKGGIRRLKLNYRKRKRTSDLYDSSSGEEEGLKRVKLNEGNVKASKNAPCERKMDPSIHAYSKILDCVSVTDLFKLGGDPEPIPWNEFKPKDGLSLNECMESVDWKTKNLSSVIASEFIAVSANFFKNRCRNRTDGNINFCGPPWEETLWRDLQEKAKLDLMPLVPSSCSNSRRALHLDYFPALRSMCRTEKNRYDGNTKRKNRFCHYFKSLGFDPRDDLLDISCDIFEY